MQSFLSPTLARRAALAAALSLGSACALDAAPGTASPGAPDSDPGMNAETVEQALSLSGSVSSGQVLSVTPSEGFKYFEMAGALCRSGSPAGVTVRRSPTGSKELLFYLQGGGACFNTQTCMPQVNKDAIADNRRSEGGGIFDLSNPNNPFKDYNIVYVPYCTGDFHLGNKRNSVPLGPSNQWFVGRRNIALILPSVVATFPGIRKVVIAGSSAGGGGATGNVAPVKRAFAASAPELYLIDDAGPFLSAGSNFLNDYLPGAEQDKWKALWGYDTTIVPECGGACSTTNFFPDFARNVQNQLGRRPALVVGKQDTTVALLYANARVDQYPLFGLVGVEMRDALNDLRTRMGGSWSTYYVTTPDSAAQQHMWLVGPTFYTVSQRTISTGAQKPLYTWVDDYLHDRPVLDVGP